ncbi:MAG: FG-GAP repeat domain-containing protein, partial [Planctomycetota bacterium]
LALGDVEGDGDLDLLCGHGPYGLPIGAQSRLYLNGGSGVFLDATNQLPAILDVTYGVALGDIDEDGDLDAVMANGAAASSSYPTGDQNQLYRNDGSGVFVLATGALPALLDDTRAVALGDLDGDGDLDALFGNQGTVAGGYRVLVNLDRQLAWRAVPGVGGPLILDLYGPPFGGVFLAFSLGSASLPVPPFGILRLDPGTIHATLASNLDAQGRTDVSYAIPADPALIGASVYWQGLVVGPSSRLTNLEITTVTDL